MQRATQRLLESSEKPLLVLHCDLPLLSADDISAALQAHADSGGLIVGCDRQGLGTNLLTFDARCVPQFCFGDDSCARHLASAQRRGFPAQVLMRPGVAIDVDEPADLQCVLDRVHLNRSGNAVALLNNTELGGRIELALETMLQDTNTTNQVNRGSLN
jgi:2-phospho-L-lactate guanylyltransferase (CobY/MobA/RfbA family)